MSQPALQTIASRRPGTGPGANRRSATAGPATNATAAVGANASSNTGLSIRRRRRQCHPCSTGRMDGRRQGRDVVGAVVASAVDEEGGGAGDAAQLRAIDVLCDTSGAGVLTQGGREAIEVEAELLCVAD